MSRRPGWGGLVLLTLVVAATGCGKDVTANELDVGVCVLDEDALNEAEIDTVSCDDEHVFELVAKFELDVDDGEDWPGDDDVRDDADAGCQGDAFTEYVGQSYDEATDVLVTAVPPSEDTWTSTDDRTVLCFAHTVDAEPTTGSLAAETS
jgi:hypothetical protein